MNQSVSIILINTRKNHRAIKSESRVTLNRNHVVSARISSQSSRHCWRSLLPHASALIQRDFGCVLGVQQTKQLPHVAKVHLVWQLGCNLGQSLSNHGPQVYYRRKIRRARRKEKQFNLVVHEEPLECVPRVVAYYPVEIWLWPSPDGKEGQLAPTYRTCNAGCLKYRQCVLEECESVIQYRPVP
ncbi:hypothetical protein TNCV_972391 [Trichonephila clavipes]|nr:hypothetical protein TNCV_972391 [Trichonephila clavipes]